MRTGKLALNFIMNITLHFSVSFSIFFFFFLKRLLRLLPLLVWEGGGAERPAFNPAHPPTPEALTHFLFKYAFIFSSRLRGRVHFLK